jgi:hypothetical protein
MAIRHADTKTTGEKGYASEWNKDHVGFQPITDANYFFTDEYISGDNASHTINPLTWNFTLSKASYVLIDVKTIVQGYPPNTGQEAWMWLEIDDVYIEGTESGWLEEETDNLDTAKEISINYIKVLSAGAHTIKVRIYLGGGSYKTNFNFGAARYIVVEKE